MAKPMLLCAGDLGEDTFANSFFDAVGVKLGDLLKKKTTSVVKYLNTALVDSKAYHNFAKMSLTGQMADSFSSAEWMTKSLANVVQKEYVPGCLKTIGLPIAWTQAQWGYRYGNALLPIVGMGSLVMCAQGKVLMLITS